MILFKKAKCVLISARIKHSLRCEAVTTTSYLINRTPSSAIGFKTPQELWSGTKPSIENEFYYKNIQTISSKDEIDRNACSQTQFYTTNAQLEQAEDGFDIAHSLVPMSSGSHSVIISVNHEASTEHETVHSSTQGHIILHPHQSGGQVSQ